MARRRNNEAVGRGFDPALIPASPEACFEESLWEVGIRFVAGLDEAGRGALAGPVAAAAVIFPPGEGIASRLPGVRDSKQLTPQQRLRARARIRAVALAWGIGFASPQEVDSLGILPATRLAAERAVAGLGMTPEHLLLDCLFLPELSLPQTSLVKGDRRCLSIAAASVLAKTARDELLSVMEQAYPGYGFTAHKGYATAAHCAALERLGPSPLHRFSFKPVKANLK